MDLMEIRRNLMNANYPLPPTFKRCDYLQAQGDRAVIDTGVAGNNDNLRFEFKFNVDRFIQYRGFFTNYASETANCWRLSETKATEILFNINSETGSSIRYGFGTYIGKDTEVSLDRSRLTITMNGNTYQKVVDVIAAGTANNSSIFINSARRASRTNDDVIKWYYFRIYDSNVLIRDYVPCVRLSDSKAGFYDLVNHAFKPSTGTVDFVAGYES